MISTVSNEYLQLVDDSLDIRIKATITATSGSPLTRVVYNANIIDGGFSYSDSVSQDGFLEIGSCIINQMTLTIDNPTDEFYSFHYAGATVMLEVGRMINGTVEYHNKGIYYIISDGYYGEMVTLTCYDRMILLDVPFINTSLYDVQGNFIATTTQNLLNLMCTQLNISCDYTTSYTTPINDAKLVNGITCRELLYYIAQTECCYARFNRYGHLELKWHKYAGSLSDTDIDATVFVVDGYRYGEMVVCHGVKISNINDHDDYQTASDGAYSLTVDGNPLINKENYLAIASLIDDKVSATYIYPFNCNVTPSELIEAGDKVRIIDDGGELEAMVGFVTNIEYTLGGAMYIACSAETLEQNKTRRGISQIARVLKTTQAAIKAINNISKTVDADGKITSLKYTYIDSSQYDVPITYDANGNITAIGGTTIT